MCQKTNVMKHFFVLLNHPAPLQKPLVLGVFRHTQHTNTLYENCRNSTFLNEKQIETLGVQSNKFQKAYLLPIQIPRDWFIH